MDRSCNDPERPDRPFSARSVALSLLLGTHPPRLTTAALVNAATLFGIAPGTTRTALSRMVAKGEVVVGERGYELAGALLERQQLQDAGRRAATAEWDGRWITVAPQDSARSVNDRREFRRRMEQGGFGELRPDYWLRPANRRMPDAGADLVVTIGELIVDDVGVLTSELWPIEALQSEAAGHLADLGRLTDAKSRSLALTADGNTWMVEAFVASAAVVRFLTREPRLPPPLVPQPWSPDQLREAYNTFEKLFQRELRSFLG